MATIIWVLLFPALFMIHDFEEIIYGHNWFKRNIKNIETKVSAKLMSKLLKSLNGTTSQFAFAVFEEFIILVVLSLFTIFYHWYGVYVCLMFGYCVHSLVHLLQSIYIKQYVPATASALATSIFILYGAFIVIHEQQLQVSLILISLPLMMLLILANGIFAHWLSKRLVK
jgi:hypothetical protein